MGDYDRDQKPQSAASDGVAPVHKPRPKDSDGSKPSARRPGQKPRPKQLGETSATPRRVKPHAEPLKFEKQISFAGVAGRETIGKPIRIENTSADERMFWTEGLGNGFALDGDDFGFIGAASSSDQTRDISVRFTPKAEGSYSSKLSIISKTVDEDHHFLDDKESHQELELVGTATALEAPQTLAVAGGPEPVHALPEVKIGARDAHNREQQALESVSSLATTFNQIVKPGDHARDDFARTIAREGAELDARLVEWCTSEGIFEMKLGGKQEGLDELASSAFMKVIEYVGEKAELGSPVVSAASFVIELGFAVNSANKKNDEEKERQEQFGERVEAISKHAASTARSSTELLMERFGGLMNNYGSARATLAAIAGESSARWSATLQKSDDHGPAATQREYENARILASSFADAMRRYGDALRAIAGAAATISDRLAHGFDTMLDRYLRARMGYGLAGDSASTPKLELAANWDLGDPAYGRKPSITLNGATFGEYTKMSDEMRTHATHKSLSEFRDMDIAVRLRCVQDGEEVVIVQEAGKDPRFSELAGSASYVAMTLGPRQILGMVGGSSLTPRTIELGK